MGIRKLIVYMLLALLAICLFIPVGCLALVVTIIVALRHWNIRFIGSFFYSLAFGLDQTGNATFGHLLNATLIKEQQVYPFGSPDQTISHVLGRNKKLDNLSPIGQGLSDLLNFIDRKHVEKAAISGQYNEKLKNE